MIKDGRSRLPAASTLLTHIELSFKTDGFVESRTGYHQESEIVSRGETKLGIILGLNFMHVAP